MVDNRQEVIEGLKGKRKFIVLSKDARGNKVDIFDIYAKDEDEAWSITEEEISEHYSSEWLFSVEEFRKFKEELNKFKD